MQPYGLTGCCDFYPRPPRGGRQSLQGRLILSSNFYPRPPRGGRPQHFYVLVRLILFLSTPSARRATLIRRIQKMTIFISIHALREEGDTKTVSRSVTALRFLSTPSARRATRWRNRRRPTSTHFYPRPPRGGRRPCPSRCCPASGFLSTPSARRATQHIFYSCFFNNISIHALREEGDVEVSGALCKFRYISIHALREEGDAVDGPRHPVDAISIHALREEGDGPGSPACARCGNFYPRPPRGGRPT